MQKAADTHFVPALIIELDRLQACLGAVRMRMLVPQLQLRGCHHRCLVPELFDGFVINPIAQRCEENAASSR